MTTTIYHNPRCSKSRQTLALLEEKGVNPTIIEYLKTPPSQDELKIIISQLGENADQIIRKKEALFKELGLDKKQLEINELAKVLNEHPSLIERPIVCHNNKVALGRPPENVLEIL